MIRRLRIAMAFLTRIPISGDLTPGARDVAAATPFFPAVGALIGSLQVCVIAALSGLGASFELQAILSTIAVVLLAGGLHQDALADMVDGFGGGRTREDVLRIMKDPRIGAFGALAIVLALGARISALTVLVQFRGGWRWIIVAAALSRCSTCLGWLLPYAPRAKLGLGSAVTDHARASDVLAGIGVGLCTAGLLLGWQAALLAIAWTGGVFGHNAFVCQRRLGGITGDTLGAATETAEVVLLVVGAVMGTTGMLATTGGLT